MSDHRLHHHKEAIDANVEKKSWKRVARVTVVPHEGLERYHGGGVEKKDAADQENTFQTQKGQWTKVESTCDQCICRLLQLSSTGYKNCSRPRKYGSESGLKNIVYQPWAKRD